MNDCPSLHDYIAAAQNQRRSTNATTQHLVYHSTLLVGLVAPQCQKVFHDCPTMIARHKAAAASVFHRQNLTYYPSLSATERTLLR